jgi:hypothetical protein
MESDEGPLDPLATCHSVRAGFAALGASTAVVRRRIGIEMLDVPSWVRGGRTTPPFDPGWALVGVALAIIFVGRSLAPSIRFPGVSLEQRGRDGFGFVVACLKFPMGTALGVFTRTVLSRLSVGTPWGAKVA